MNFHISRFKFYKLRDLILIIFKLLIFCLFLTGKIIHYSKYNSLSSRNTLLLNFLSKSVKPTYPAKKLDYLNAWYLDNGGYNISNYKNLQLLYTGRIGTINNTNINNYDPRCFIEDYRGEIGRSGCFIEKDILLNLQQKTNNTKFNTFLTLLINKSLLVKTNGVILLTNTYRVSREPTDFSFEKIELLTNFAICTTNSLNYFNQEKLSKYDVPLFSTLTPSTIFGLNCTGSIDNLGNQLYTKIPPDCSNTQIYPPRCDTYKTKNKFMSEMALANYSNFPGISEMYGQAIFGKKKQEIYELSQSFITSYKTNVKLYKTITRSNYGIYKKKGNEYFLRRWYVSQTEINNLPGISILFVLLQGIILLLLTFYVNRNIHTYYDIYLYMARQGTIYIIWFQLLLFYYFNFNFYEALKFKKISTISDELELISIYINIIIYSAEIIHTNSAFTGYNKYFRSMGYILLISYFSICWTQSNYIFGHKIVPASERKIYNCADVNICIIGSSYFLVIILPIFLTLFILRNISQFILWLKKRNKSREGNILNEITITNEYISLNSFEKKCIGGRIMDRLVGYDENIIYNNQVCSMEAISLLGYAFINDKYLIRKKDLVYLCLYILFKKIIYTEKINVSITLWKLCKNNNIYTIDSIFHIYYNNIDNDELQINYIGKVPVDIM